MLLLAVNGTAEEVAEKRFLVVAAFPQRLKPERGCTTYGTSETRALPVRARLRSFSATSEAVPFPNCVKQVLARNPVKRGLALELQDWAWSSPV